jgi:hypothetical protein
MAKIGNYANIQMWVSENPTPIEKNFVPTKVCLKGL